MAEQKVENLAFVAGEVHALLGVVTAISFELRDRERIRQQLEALEQALRARTEAMPVPEGYLEGIEHVFSSILTALKTAKEQ